jgi:hypothetical protein
MGGYVRSVSRVVGPPNIHYYQEAAAGLINAFHPGDLVKLNAAGELVIASAGVILGIAEKTATGTASTEIPVDVISADEEFIAKYKAAATAEALAQDIADFTFTVSTTAGHTLDESGATTDARIVDHDPRDPWTTSGGRLIIRFLDSALQMGETVAKAT